MKLKLCVAVLAALAFSSGALAQQYQSGGCDSAFVQSCHPEAGVVAQSAESLELQGRIQRDHAQLQQFLSDKADEELRAQNDEALVSGQYSNFQENYIETEEDDVDRCMTAFTTDMIGALFGVTPSQTQRNC